MWTVSGQAGRSGRSVTGSVRAGDSGARGSAPARPLVAPGRTVTDTARNHDSATHILAKVGYV